MFLFFILLLTSTSCNAAASSSHFKDTNGYTPLRLQAVIDRSESIESEEDASNVNQPLLLETEVYIPATTPFSSRSFDDLAFTEEPVVDPKIKPVLTKFMTLRKEAQRYEGRNLDKDDRNFLSNNFLQRVLENPDPSITINTLDGTVSIFKRIIFREENSDIDYIARNLKGLSTLSPSEHSAVMQAERRRDLKTLEEIQHAHAITVFRPTASPSKSCLRREAFAPHDSGTETTPTTSERERRSISFSDDSPDMIDLSSPTKKNPDAGKGALSLLFGDDSAE